MYVTKEGTLLEKELTDEDEERLRLREHYLQNPIEGGKALIDFIETNPERATILVNSLKKRLDLDKYPESMLVRIYDLTRYDLFIYLKSRS